MYNSEELQDIKSEVLREGPAIRERLILTSKCGIRGKNNPKENDPARYDFSKEYILKSVEGSLSRLNTDYLDLLLLHRPDYLCDPEEVTEAFQNLQESGKVMNFGVSNFLPSQVS